MATTSLALTMAFAAFRIGRQIHEPSGRGQAARSWRTLNAQVTVSVRFSATIRSAAHKQLIARSIYEGRSVSPHFDHRRRCLPHRLGSK
jgi:hypothetical protein